MSSDIKDVLSQLESFFIELNTQGMKGKWGNIWPVIIDSHFHYQTIRYEYKYPKGFFTNLQLQQKILIPYELRKWKSNRLAIVKMIIDKHMTGEIDIFMYHFGMFLIYGDYSRNNDDFSEGSIGKKRAQFVQTLPNFCFMSTDDYISAVWSHLIEYRGTDTHEYQRNPYMKNVRILFANEQFAAWTGLSYSEDVTWVEPISYESNLKCRKWSEENDPMAPIKIPEGWVQGEIILGQEGSYGLRHYVEGVPIHAGSAIQVKFGNGWISGRYEWSFDRKSKIQIHCNEDVFYISEGHTVRVRS